ncbi:MAG: BlaI/MecI/CopY family transcriptional regulator [Lachnospiraceae bacterium]|jgi:BlaI family penicillinase repressor|uniref:BlaI/MecI/CopY family transcriptional regulator n=1 Tax=Candidatus Merdisoma sp. JLR.KK006 TaxID=3112626 RepID=UPI002FF0AC7D|nr:BlaI/MecI/CopY family transcriptional regulator [Lachnospiraceae bacterium]
MDYHINESEYRLMDILWDVEPVNSMELVGLCREGLGWKKSTTYTILRSLGEKQIVRNENAIVRTLVSRGQIQRQESREFLEKKFRGSLPAFIAAFLQEEKLTKKEARELQELINQASEEGEE